MATETKTFYPGAYEGLSAGTSGDLDAVVGKGSTNTGTTAYISATMNRTSYCYFPFDVSAIPDEADIESVSCVAKAYIYNKKNGDTYLQLYSGTTAKGSSVEVTEDSPKTYSLNAGTWTRAELSSIRLRLYAKSSGNSVTLHFYGADLIITYTYQSEKFMLKLGGAWHDIVRVFKKVSGIWVEKTELANVIEDGVRYQNGGEIESTGPALISFKIGAVTYEAEEGMTWEQWCASSYYNPLGFSIGELDGYVWFPGDTGVVGTSTSQKVKPYDKIVAGTAYVNAGV